MRVQRDLVLTLLALFPIDSEKSLSSTRQDGPAVDVGGSGVVLGLLFRVFSVSQVDVKWLWVVL